jgi:catalase
MLQGRMPSYDDAHRYRIGTNFEDVPVNQPKNTEAANYHQNGTMRSDGNNDGGPNYEPNSFGGPVEKPEVEQPPLSISGDADRYEAAERIDNFKQPGDMFRDVMNEEQKEHLMDNFADDMEPVDEKIQKRQLVHFYKADSRWGRGVAERLGIDIEDAVDDDLLALDDNKIAHAPVVADLRD